MLDSGGYGWISWHAGYVSRPQSLSVRRATFERLHRLKLVEYDKDDPNIAVSRRAHVRVGGRPPCACAIAGSSTAVPRRCRLGLMTLDISGKKFPLCGCGPTTWRSAAKSGP
jgi:hypothetical protein